MALATYSNLLTSAASWLARSDLTSQIPDFVTIAQAVINREVRAQAMETKTTSFSITGEYVNVPADFLEVRHFYIPSSPRVTLKREDSERMNEYYTTDTPVSFDVVGTQFRFAPVPASTETATLVYYAKPATLAATTQETNSLFPANADLYLWATLLAAEAFIQNDPRLGVWKQAYADALGSINGQAKRQAAMGGSMTTRAG